MQAGRPSPRPVRPKQRQWEIRRVSHGESFRIVGIYLTAHRGHVGPGPLLGHCGAPLPLGRLWEV